MDKLGIRHMDRLSLNYMNVMYYIVVVPGTLAMWQKPNFIGETKNALPLTVIKN